MERALVGWENFFVAQAGAAAAFAGLLFVAVSINLTRILAVPHLPGRAGEVMVLLLALLSVAMLGLVPLQSNEGFGVELLLLGAITLAISAALQVRDGSSPAFYRWARLLTTVPPSLFVVGAGLSLLRASGGGLVWLAPASVWGFAGVGLNAWVLLVEILR
jgi:modulator of FtsH protease